MGWETRRNQRYYYYKQRLNGKVVSTYMGRGTAAELADGMGILTTDAMDVDRWERRQQRDNCKAQDAAEQTAFDTVETVFQQAMTDAGYHRHKRGEWRKRREQK